MKNLIDYLKEECFANPLNTIGMGNIVMPSIDNTTMGSDIICPIQKPKKLQNKKIKIKNKNKLKYRRSMKSLSTFIGEALDNTIKAFVIIKPGFLKYAKEIFDYIISKGFILQEKDTITLSDKQAADLYKPHKGKDFYNDLCKYMTSGKITYGIFSFDNNTNPDTNTINLMNDIKSHFRNKYGEDEMRNCMHSSDSLKNVKRESKIMKNI